MKEKPLSRAAIGWVKVPQAPSEPTEFSSSIERPSKGAWLMVYNELQIEHLVGAACALGDLLEQIECLGGVEYCRDLEPYKAAAVWEGTLSDAQTALQRAYGKRL